MKTPNIGALANKLASKGAAQKTRLVQGRGNPKMDKDAFFKLMMTQAKNQDPTNPLKSHEMAAQLAQFSSLEQMSGIKGVLNEMKEAQAGKTQFQALDLMGKTVSGAMDKVQKTSADSEHDIAFQLGGDASQLKVSIRDGQGDVVREIAMKDQLKGKVRVRWDGKNQDGVPQPVGSYRVSVEAANDEKRVPVETDFKGTVTGVQFGNQGTVLKIGDRSVLMSEVQTIENGSSPKPVKNIPINQKIVKR